MSPNSAITPSLRESGLSAPITVTWEVTNRCNLRCSHCLSDSGPEADTHAELNLEQAKRVVEQLAEAQVFQIHFGGGEPFVYPGFMELLRHAQRRGFCCLCISTNGALLNAARIAELEALGGIYLQISMDGATEQSCDALRGAGAYRRALAALGRLRGTAIVRTVNFVCTRANAHELDAMHALAESQGATLRVTRLKPSGRGAIVYQSLRLTGTQQSSLHAWLERHPNVLTGDTFFHLNALGGKPLPGFRFCGAAKLTCLITPNGDVFPCPFTQSAEFLAGNLRRLHFQQIWSKGEVFNTTFRGETEGPCGSCSGFAGCGGGCPAVKHAVAGRLDVPDPDCVLDLPGTVVEAAPLCHG